MAQDLKAWYMPIRRDWNRMAEPLPAWFRSRLRRVDRMLRLQFIPPSNLDPEGVPCASFPHGVWYICGRVKGTRWLIKRAVYALVDDGGKPVQPTMELIRILKVARNLRRQRRFGDLERRAAEQIRQYVANARAESREALMERIAGTLRRMNASSFARPRVFIPDRAAC